MVFCKYILAASPNVMAGLQTDNLNIYYINGINTEDKEAALDAATLAARLGLPSSKVESIYNSSAGFLSDILETYQAASFDGGENNTINFWRWIYDISLMPDLFRLAYFAVYATFNSTPISMRADLDKAESATAGDRSANRRSLIFSHSQGNFFTNFLIDRITASDRELGTQCTGNVAVATPATYVTNNDPWVTNVHDDTINLARLFLPYGGRILPANVNNLPLDFDPSGHFFNETYLRPRTEALRGVINAADTVAARLNRQCADGGTCGKPLQPAGGQGRNQVYTYNIANPAAHNLTISFEAYYVPDRMKVYSQTGQLLYDTGGLVSGFHQQTIAYNPARHGTYLQVIVDAPTAGTGWKFCVDCQQNATGCDLLRGRKSVNYSFYRGDHNWSCSVSELQIDKQPLGSTRSGSVYLSPGTHQFSKVGGCTCTSRYGNFCNNPPYVTIDNRRYNYSNGAFEFDIN